MENELSSLTGAYEVEYCGLDGQKEIFSINCSVPDNVTKDEVLKQIFETFNISQSLRNLGIQMELIGEMFCNESTTSTSNGTFYWPIKKIGTDVTIPCHANVATRHCSSGEMVHLEMPTNQYGASPKCSPFTGVWQEPDMSQCYNTEGITQQLKNITSEDIGKENVEEVSTILSDISKKSVYFKAEDIDLAVDIQEKMLPLISNVMLDIIEAIPEEIPLEGQQLTALHPNLGIGVIKVEKDTFNGAVYGISFGNKENEAKTMVTQNSSTKANTIINSNIIAANIPNIKVTNLDEPVNISFNLIDQHATENDINIRHKGNEESDEQYSPPRGLIERLPSDQSTQRPEDTRNSIEPVKDSQENDKTTVTEDLAFAEEHRESMAEMRQKILNTLEVVRHTMPFKERLSSYSTVYTRKIPGTSFARVYVNKRKRKPVKFQNPIKVLAQVMEQQKRTHK
ncbi:Hypothetical predicted protein [Octopus vulgaris]|uniref:Uncharacterized protein n=1 Tax=Octopus vulgaris TaxID=6645 RepID=A0AA36B667_OCTVU|nr:Hypothetical predicted protein [Octopus vulgaris]